MSSVTTADRRSEHRRRRTDGGTIVRWVLVGVVIVAVLIPLLWTLRIATRLPTEYTRSPARVGGTFTLSNFSDAWTNGRLAGGFVNTLLVAPLAALLTTAFTALAGYALAKLWVPWRRVVFGLLVCAIAVPLPAIVLSIFQEAVNFGFVNNHAGVALVYAGIQVPWGAYFLYGAFRTIPDPLIEAARVEGAGELRTFLRVGLPMARAALMTVFILNLFITWSELLLALVLLPNAESQTVIVRTAQLNTKYEAGGPVSAAGVLLAAAPIIVAFFAAQRFLRPAQLSGGVKT